MWNVPVVGIAVSAVRWWYRLAVLFVSFICSFGWVPYLFGITFILMFSVFFYLFFKMIYFIHIHVIFQDLTV
jgi:hypothetical protein